MTITSYCTLARFRTITGLGSSVISDSVANEKITQAHYQILREGFVKISEELASKDDNDRYFTEYRYIADGDLDGDVDTGDLLVYEYDSTNKLLVDISSQVASIDGLNNFFTLSTGYPTESRSVYVTYYISNRPIAQLKGDYSILEEAVARFAEQLCYATLKKTRMYDGVISWSAGDKTLTRDEKEFDAMVQKIMQRYNTLIQKIRPFYGKRARVGRGLSQRRGRRLQGMMYNEPLTHNGRLLYY